MTKSCFNCDNGGFEFHGYIICDDCKKKLRLFTDESLLRFRKDHESKGKSFESEINRRIDVLEKDYIKKRIKLLDIKERLQHL